MSDPVARELPWPAEWIDNDDPLECRAFYELMQRYRWARIDGPDGDVIPAWEAVKGYIDYYYRARPKP